MRAGNTQELYLITGPQLPDVEAKPHLWFRQIRSSWLGRLNESTAINWSLLGAVRQVRFIQPIQRISKRSTWLVRSPIWTRYVLN